MSEDIESPVDSCETLCDHSSYTDCESLCDCGHRCFTHYYGSCSHCSCCSFRLHDGRPPISEQASAALANPSFGNPPQSLAGWVSGEGSTHEAIRLETPEEVHRAIDRINRDFYRKNIRHQWNMLMVPAETMNRLVKEHRATRARVRALEERLEAANWALERARRSNP